MDVKFGKVRPNNFLLTSSTKRADENFFESAPSFDWEAYQQKKSLPSNRINDYDSTIMENNAYQGISDEMFKLEHKIGILENILSKLTGEIEALQSLGASIQISDLLERKRKIEQELVVLNKQYSNLGLGSKISGQIAAAVNSTSNKKMNVFSKAKGFFEKQVLAKIFQKINTSQIMKEALENLSGINSSVDELINLQIPYGESINRYEKLTAYLNKANKIHFQISKNINAISKKKVR